VPGDCDFGYDRDRSSLVFSGPKGQSYFFVFEKLDKIYRGSDIPRFTKDDAVRYAEKHSTMNIRPGITLSTYWDKSENFSLVCTEEGTFKLWTWGRIACVGDSAHKMTPNIGAGGNAGIESAAALANAIKSIVDKSKGERPSNEMVENELRAYQRQRERRAASIIHSAGEVTRMQASKTLYHRFMAELSRLYPGDFIANFLGDYFSDAVMLVSL
jgi:2-polyprenyl-6-methoxyphenol hydroxylase-like FAD-dependent oxidoreductase